MVLGPGGPMIVPPGGYPDDESGGTGGTGQYL
jgi:hypothetical protein